jgi:manganese transport protein
MEGFLRLRMKPWARRLLTRSLAIVPALVCAAVLGNRAVGRLLVLSQVVLSLQLSFAVVPLVQFTSCKAYVGQFANGWALTIATGIIALLIAGLNCYLLVQTFLGGGLTKA